MYLAKIEKWIRKNGGCYAEEVSWWRRCSMLVILDERFCFLQGTNGVNVSVMNERTKLGRNGPSLSRVGLGCMGMSEFYGPSDDQKCIAVIQRAIEFEGCCLDTADMYGRGANEELVGRAVAGRRNEVFLATKFGIRRDGDSTSRLIDGTPTYVKQACEASLRRLGTDYIDLYYQHRVDSAVPVEETVGAMAELVREGKVRFLGLSEAAPETLRRANAVHHISALQTELSLWSREPEEELLALCAELGVSFVAYSPLGRGFLTGEIRAPDDLAGDDYRLSIPRFSADNFERNYRLVNALKELAEAWQVSVAQLALSWVLSRGDHVVAIPGTRSCERLLENMAAGKLCMSKIALEALDHLMPANQAAGTRYTLDGMGLVNR